ncbi:NusA-like transcription termination signal-binding factor [Candidatus Micrarchaeota archaeon]|nr:NusA-like transcription termination signal-binding factor [Candidatus Micrarchaeota archaeon]
MVELTEDDLNIFSNFERITRVMPVDYLATETSMVFLVEPESLGKAIGKKASNIEKLKKVFRKRVIVLPDSDDPEKFLRSFYGNINIYDIDVRNVMGENSILLTIDEKDRGIAIGKSGDRIKAAKSLLKKKFNATLQLKTRRSME